MAVSESGAVQPHLATGAVEFHAAGLQNARRGGLIAELQLDAGDQFAHEERLHHIIVGAEFQPHDAVRLAGARGQEDHRDGGQIGILADAFADIEAVGIGQHDIQQNQVRPHLAAQLDGALSGMLSR